MKLLSYFPCQKSNIRTLRIPLLIKSSAFEISYRHISLHFLFSKHEIAPPYNINLYKRELLRLNFDEVGT